MCNQQHSANLDNHQTLQKSAKTMQPGDKNIPFQSARVISYLLGRSNTAKP
jgi:hypothetical protein